MDISNSTLNNYFSEITQELFIALDAAGTIVYINRKGCEILEEEEQHLLGKNWFDNFYDKTLRHEIKYVYLELISNNFAFKKQFENIIESRTGKTFLVSWHNKAIYNEQGNITHVLSAGIDITKSKECELKLNRATLALESAMEKIKKDAE